MTYQLSESLTLMPEWANVEAIILAWPHEDTDWHPWIDDARATYVNLIKQINEAGAIVLLLCREQDLGIIKSVVPMGAKVALVVVEYNDTWTRDYAFVTCSSEIGNVPVEFLFNGWGEKFDARKDNLVNETLAKYCLNPLISCPIVLEGGAIEIDENQHLLSTASCLYNPKRNGDMQAAAYKQIFAQYLGAQETIIFENGHLEGDDTDGHIDTLVRFTPLRGLVMQSAYNRTDDSHFEGLSKLKKELKKAFPDYKIHELPLPNVVNEDNERLPASYANFLICNQHILAPMYQQPEDNEAIKVLKKAYPNHKVIAVDCSTLVKQFGSLHCITMQIPVNTLDKDVIDAVADGLAQI